MADIKVQLVFGQEAHTDQRGTPAGQAEGDHHRTVKEWRVDGPLDSIIAGAAALNDKVVEAGVAMFDALRDEGVLDEVLAGAALLMGEDVSDAKFFGILTRVYDND